MSIAEIKAYVTTDHCIFTDLHKAAEHQKTLDFIKWYETGDTYLYSVKNGDDMCEWLKKHKDIILAYLKEDK